MFPVKETTDLEKISHTIISSFTTIPITTYIFQKYTETPVVLKSREQLVEQFTKVVAYRLRSGDIVTECNDHAAVAIWKKPDHESDPIRHTSDSKFNEEWIDRPNAIKKKLLGDIPRYSLYMIGKDFDREDTRGCAGQLLEHFTKRADAEGCAIYLEAVSLQAKSLYEKYGFKCFMDIKFGSGEVNEKGVPDKNGRGYVCYFMVYYSGELNAV